MSIIVWLIVGGLAGWIASKIAGTDAQQGWVMNIVMGIVGAFVFGAIARALFDSDGAFLDFSIVSLIGAIIGALILSFGLGAITGKRSV